MSEWWEPFGECPEVQRSMRINHPERWRRLVIGHIIYKVCVGIFLIESAWIAWNLFVLWLRYS